jgi:hypothetical protein
MPTKSSAAEGRHLRMTESEILSGPQFAQLAPTSVRTPAAFACLKLPLFTFPLARQVRSHPSKYLKSCLLHLCRVSPWPMPSASHRQHIHMIHDIILQCRLRASRLPWTSMEQNKPDRLAVKSNKRNARSLKWKIGQIGGRCKEHESPGLGPELTNMSSYNVVGGLALNRTDPPCSPRRRRWDRNGLVR